MPINWLRQPNIFDQFGVGNTPNYMDDGSGGEALDSDPFPASYPSMDMPTGQEPLNPDAARLFRQSMQPQPQPDSQDQDWQTQLRNLYHPQTSAAERYAKLLDQFPQHEDPSFMRKLVASGVAWKGGPKAADEVLDAPFKEQLEDWKTRAEPFGKAADIERQNNINEKNIAQQTITAAQNQQKINETERKNRANETLKSQYQEMLNAKNNGYKFDVVGDHYIAHAPDGSSFDTGYDASKHTPLEVATITGKYRVEAANIGATAREQAATIAATGRNQVAETNAGSREIYNIPDPNDPTGTKQIAVRVDPGSGKVTRVTLDEKQVGPVAKPPSGAGAGGGPNALTTQTKNMMQGAQMMLPLVADVGAQAADLEKRNLFGPVMSRVRALASKVGTTGTPGEVQKSLEEFAVALKDPSFNPGDDFAVGQFLDSLGFLASGAARVHSRTGGSMGMINYFKALLTSETSLNMFNGKLTALNKLLTDYAVGPTGSVVTGTKSVGLNEALDKIFGTVKQ